MAEIVKNIASESEKCGYNPEKDTNWCNLPMEMRAECIKRMDFKTRTRLGATAHTEKSLIDIKKFHFDSVKLIYCSCPSGYLQLITDDLEIQIKSINNHKKTLNCLGQMMKNCQIDTFEYSEMRCRDDRHGEVKKDILWKKLQKCAPFRFKTFKLSSNNPKNARRFLANSEGVENIMLFDLNYKLLESTDFYKLPAIFQAKQIQIDYLDLLADVQKTIQKLIDIDAKVGKSLRFVHKGNLTRSITIDSISSKFENRVISKTDKEVRIRTDNESKHILIRFDKKDHSDSFYSCTIIPSNILESECEKDDQWIKDLLLHNRNVKLTTCDSLSIIRNLFDFSIERWQNYYNYAIRNL